MCAEAAPSAPLAGLWEVPPRPGVQKPDPILVVDGVRKRYGGLSAVDVSHLEIQRHAITALIGPNGAGKTTLFNLITGFERPDAGTWSFEGTAMAGLPAYRIARRGIVRTFQLTRVLPRMRVVDNLKLAAPDQRGESFFGALVPASWRAQDQALERRSDEVLERFQLRAVRDQLAGALSGGQRKLLEMARALMAQPRLLMLDEPMAGVNPALTQTLLEHVLRLREEGMTILFVEHDMDVVREISDWVVCMAEGAIIAEGPPHVVAANPLVIDAYLGRAAGDEVAPPPEASG